MPVKICRLHTGAIVLLKTCDVCGRDASFMVGASVRKAYEAIGRKEITEAKKLLGKSFCLDHWRTYVKTDIKATEPRQAALF